MLSSFQQSLFLLESLFLSLQVLYHLSSVHSSVSFKRTFFCLCEKTLSQSLSFSSAFVDLLCLSLFLFACSHSVYLYYRLSIFAFFIPSFSASLSLFDINRDPKKVFPSDTRRTNRTCTLCIKKVTFFKMPSTILRMQM